MYLYRWYKRGPDVCAGESILWFLGFSVKGVFGSLQTTQTALLPFLLPFG